MECESQHMAFQTLSSIIVARLLLKLNFGSIATFEDLETLSSRGETWDIRDPFSGPSQEEATKAIICADISSNNEVGKCKRQMDN